MSAGSLFDEALLQSAERQGLSDGNRGYPPNPGDFQGDCLEAYSRNYLRARTARFGCDALALGAGGRAFRRQPTPVLRARRRRLLAIFYSLGWILLFLIVTLAVLPASIGGLS